MDGKVTLLWENTWLCDKPLCTTHPILYEWCRDKNITVHEMRERRGHLEFDRWLPPDFFLKNGCRYLRKHLHITLKIRVIRLVGSGVEKGSSPIKAYMNILQVANPVLVLLTYGKLDYHTKSKYSHGCSRKMLSLLRIIW